MTALPKENTKLLSLSQAAKHLGVSIDTVRRWDKKGKLQGIRTPGGHRRFAIEELNRIKSPTTPALRGTSKTQTSNQPAPILTTDYQLPATEFPNLYDQLPVGRKIVIRVATVSFLCLLALLMLSKTAWPVADQIISKYLSPTTHNPQLTTGSTVLQAATEIQTFAVNVPSELRESVIVSKDLNVTQTTTTDTLDTTTLVLGGTTVISTATEINYLNDLTLTDGGVVYSTDTGLAVSAAGSSNQVLVSSGTDTPAWKALTDLDSGLDVDKIDGLDSAAFLRSNASDTFESGSTLTVAGTLDINSDVSIADTNIAFDGATTTFTTTGDLFIQGASGNQVTIGGTSSLAKLGIDGNADEIQLLVQGYSTQTSNTFVIEQSDGTDILAVGNSGVLTLTNSGSTNTTFNLSGTADFVIQDNGTTFVTFNSNGDVVFADNTMLDLSAIIHDDSTPQGIKLPQTTSFTTLSTGEGFLGWDTDDNKLVIFNGTSWVDVAAAGESLFTDGGTTTYLTATTDDLAVGGTDSESNLFFDESLSGLHLNPYGTSTGNTGEIDFEELEANGDNYTGFKAPDSLAANVIYKLPSADATVSNQVLASDAAGVLSWINVSAGAGTLWTDGGAITYLTSTTDDITVGGTDSDSNLFFDESLSGLHLNPYGTSTGNTGEIDFEELEANGDNYTGFKAPDTLAANLIYVLPSADGSITQVLSTDGAGTLSWISASGVSGAPWTKSLTNVYTTTTTDEVILGGTTPLSSAKLSIDGDSDQIQFIVQGFSTQTTDLAVFENSSGTDQFNFSNAGNFTAAGVLDINGSGTHDIAGTLNLSGTTLTASGDLTITPVGGDVILGSSVALTASKVNKVIVVDGNTYAQTCAGINAAIDALGSSGGEIYLPQATYTCAETIFIDADNTTIRGAGYNNTIINAASQNLSPVMQTCANSSCTGGNSDYTTLQDFKIIGSAGGTGGDNIEVFGQYTQIDSVFIKSADDDGIAFGANGNGNSSYSSVTDSLIDGSDVDGIEVGSQDNIQIIDNVITANTGRSISFEDSAVNNIAEGNYISGGTLGILANCEFCTISNNQIVSVGSTGIGYGTNTRGIEHSIISNNYIYTPGASGIDVLAEDGGNTITGNQIYFPLSNAYGIEIRSNNNTVTGNTIIGNANSQGIRNLFGDENIYTGNYLVSLTTGISFDSTADNNVVASNNFESVTTNFSDSSTTTAYINTEDGYTAIGSGDASPDYTLELYDVTNTPTFGLSDDDIAHGLTTLAQTDVFSHLTSISTTTGGALWTGISDTGADQAINIRGVLGSTDPTDTVPAVKIIGGKASGTTIGDLGADETVFQIANNDDTSSLTVLGDGSVGINTVTPLGTFHVVDQSTSHQGKALAVFNQTENQDILTASSSGTTRFAVSNTGELFIGSNTTLTTSTATCWESKTRNGATVYHISDCTGTPADYAEQYPVSEGISYGDIVTLGTEDVVDNEGEKIKRLVKATKEYDQNAIGVVSNNWHDFTSAGSASLDKEDNPMPVALSGRVPVKVASYSEVIEPGDFITTSGEPGRAMKAIKSGYVIGKALEAWSNDKETVMVFVNNTFYSGLALNESGEITNNQELAPGESESQLTTETQEVATDSGLVRDIEELKTKVSELEGKLTLLESQQILGTATSSALPDTNYEPLATGSAELTTLGDTVVTGILNVGTLQFDSLTNSIDAIGILSLQPLALGEIKFLGGLITFDTKGNVTAKEIQAEKYVVLGESAGHSILPAGSTKIEIATNQVTTDSLILVTPTTITNRQLIVTKKEEGVGFTVEVNSMQLEDVEFDWFIVDHKDDTTNF